MYVGRNACVCINVWMHVYGIITMTAYVEHFGMTLKKILGTNIPSKWGML